MACGITNQGGTFAISTTTANADLDESGFSALTYVEVPGLSTSGDTGVTQNVVSYPTWDQQVVCKGKGMADAGDPTLEFVDAPSAGMSAMLAAAEVDNQDNYAFRYTWADGTVEYNRGLVTGPQYLKGGNEDFKRIAFTLGLQQPPVVVAPSP